MAERCARTLKTTMYLEHIGYTVIEEYECCWNKIEQSNAEAQRTKHLWHIPKPNSRVHFDEESIIEGVQRRSIFGLISVDIHTHLKDNFSEMTPIFKNTREDLGKHMKDHLERESRIKRPQRQ